MKHLNSSLANRRTENGKRKTENTSPFWNIITTFSTFHFPLSTARSGYVYLISVLFVSAIAVSALGSYLLLSIASLENGITFEASSQALENAQTCAEQALMELFLDSGYTGGQTVTLSNGTCDILQPGGFGNTNRTLCTEGISGAHTRRIEIVLSQLLPSIQVYSWQEVASITACSY